LYVSLSIRDPSGGLLFPVVPHLLPQWGPFSTSAIRVIWPLLIGLVHIAATIVLLLVNRRLLCLLLLLVCSLLLLVLTGIGLLLLLLLLCVKGA